MSLPLRFTTPEELAERAGWSPRKVREISIEVHASFAPIFAMRLAIQVIPFSDDLRYIMQARQGESDLTSLSEPERKITANSHRADCPERVVRMVGVGGAIEPLKWFRSSHFCAILCRHSAARKDVRLTPELDVGTHHLAGGKVGRWISTCPAHGRTPSRNQARPECYLNGERTWEYGTAITRLTRKS